MIIGKQLYVNSYMLFEGAKYVVDNSNATNHYRNSLSWDLPTRLKSYSLCIIILFQLEVKACNLLLLNFGNYGKEFIVKSV